MADPDKKHKQIRVTKKNDIGFIIEIAPTGEEEKATLYDAVRDFPIL